MLSACLAFAASAMSPLYVEHPVDLPLDEAVGVFPSGVEVRGILLTGICESLLASPRALSESRLARVQQAASEARARFELAVLLAPVAPELDFVTDLGPRGQALGCIRDLAQLCRLTGLHGVVIDFRPSTGLLNPLHGVYSAHAPDHTLAKTREFGRLITEAVLDISPDACLGVVGPAPPEGPLVSPLLEGMAEGSRRHPDARLLFLALPVASGTADAVTRFDAWRAVHWSARAERAWSQKGKLILGLPADGIGAAGSIAANPAGLWTQGAPSAAVTNIMAALAEYTVVGPADLGGGFYALTGPAGGALLHTGGPAHECVLAIESPPRLVDLASGESRLPDVREGKVVFPPAHSPTLLHPVSVREHVIPAAMQLTLSGTGDGAGLAVEYGFWNPARVAMTGTLSAVANGAVSVAPGAVAFALQPGERLDVRGVLRGEAPPATALPMRLVLTLADEPPIERAFRLIAPLTHEWQAVTPVPATALTADGPDGIILNTSLGTAVLIDGAGKVQWQRSFASPLSLPPACGRHWTLGGYVAMADDAGALHVLRPDGRLRWKAEFGAGATAVTTARLHPFTGDEIVLAARDCSVHAYASNGQALWRAELDSAAFRLLTCLLPGDDYSIVLALAEDGRVTALDHGGRKRWSVAYPAQITAAAILAPCAPGPRARLAIGHADGTCRIVDAATAEEAAAVEFGASPVNGIFVLKDSRGFVSQLVVSADSLCGASADLRVEWTAPVRAITAVAPAQTSATGAARRLIALTADTLACIGDRGEVDWAVPLPAEAVSIPPAVHDLDGDGRLECVYSLGDGTTRVVELPEH